MSSTQKLFVILGMHRSGTSVLTRCMKVFGIALGDHLMPAMDNNPKGFWEDTDLNNLNIQLLSFLSRDWHHLQPLTKKEVERLLSSDLHQQAIQLLKDKLSAYPSFAFKDPRVSILLPYWCQVFKQCDIAPKYIITLRNPLSVSQSLYVRDQFSLEKACYLWLTHILTALVYTQDQPRLLVEYDSLLNHLEVEILRISQFLKQPIIQTELDQFNNDFLDIHLRHNKHNLDQLITNQQCPKLVAEVYLHLHQLAKNHTDLASPDLLQVINEWCNAYTEFYPLLKCADNLLNESISIADELSNCKSDISQLEQRFAEKNSQIVNLNEAISDLKHTFKSVSEQQNAAIFELTQHLQHMQAHLYQQFSPSSHQQITSLENRFSKLYKINMEIVRMNRKPHVLQSIKSPFFMLNYKYQKWRSLLNSSPLFSSDWYYDQYEDIAKLATLLPVDHYLRFGWKEHRNPGPDFDTTFYLQHYPDVSGFKGPALVHYLLYGQYEGRFINQITQHSFVSANTDLTITSEDEILISVVIPTYNRLKLLPSIIDQWKRVDQATTFSYELIFSDDGSSDNSVEFLHSIRELPLTILENDHGGASNARNAAIKAAKGRRILFVGDDIYPEPDFLNTHLRLSQQLGSDVAILGEVVWHEALAVNHLMEHITEIGNEQFSYNRLPDNDFVDFRHFYTCNISVDRTLLLNEETLFDLTFNEYGYEDIELGYRLCQKGMRIYYTREAIGAHYHPYNVAGFCKRQFCAGRMAIVFSQLHPGLDPLLGIQKTPKLPTVKDQHEWDNRKELLIARCELYENLIARLSHDHARSLKYYLSLLYSQLFQAMYQAGYLSKLSSNQDTPYEPLAYHLQALSEDFWSSAESFSAEHLLQISKEELIAVSCLLEADISRPDLQALSIDEAALSTKQAPLLLEFRAIQALDKHISSKVIQPLKMKTMVKSALVLLKNEPAMLIKKIQQRLSKLNPFKLTQQSATLLNPHLNIPLNPTPALLLYNLNLIETAQQAFAKRGLPVDIYRVNPDMTATLFKDGNDSSHAIPLDQLYHRSFYWPDLNLTDVNFDHILSALLSLHENSLDFAIVSHTLDTSSHLKIHSLKNNSVFNRKILLSMINDQLDQVACNGKILRLLPAWGNTRTLSISDCLGQPIKANANGYFHSTSITSSTKIEAAIPLPLLPINSDKPVIFVFPIFLAVGGVERNTVEIMRQLRNDFDFVVITMEQLTANQGSLAGQANEVAAAVIEMPEIIDYKRYLNLLEQFKLVFNPSLVWVCNGSPWFCDNAMNIRKLFADIPIIDQQVYDTQHGWINRYHEPGIQSFDQFIAVNKKIKAKFSNDLKILETKTTLIYSALDTDKIKLFQSKPIDTAHLREKYGIPVGKRVFTFVARLTEQKRPALFLEIVKQHQAHTDDIFVMVGNGELDKALIQTIEKEGLNNLIRIEYIENTLELHQVSDGIIFTSAFEGLPIAMLEALTIGVPAFSTDTGDIADILNEYIAGEVVPVDIKSAELYQSFLSWTSKLSMYQAHLMNAKPQLLERFSSSTIAKQYLQCWNNAISLYHHEKEVNVA